MPRYRYDDEDVVVIVGSGAGGGTLANELCQKGVKVVVLEAGRHHTPDEFINDEWRSFKQLAWLDNRTTSGSFRVATDFPNLPAWICKTVGGTTVHWAGCCPRFMEHEFKASTYHEGIDGVNSLDWPISLADIEPYYDRGKLVALTTHTVLENVLVGIALVTLVLWVFLSHARAALIGDQHHAVTARP